MKIRPVGGEVFNAVRQTDMTKLNSPFSKFCERFYKHSVSQAVCLGNVVFVCFVHSDNGELPVNISDVSHVTPLSKNYLVLLFCSLVNVT